MTPREIIEAEYGDSRNFLTPRRLGIGALPDGAYELSYSSSSLMNRPMWAVSVVRLNPNGSTRRDTDASNVFYSTREAHNYIRKLKRA